MWLWKPRADGVLIYMCFAAALRYMRYLCWESIVLIEEHFSLLFLAGMSAFEA